MNITANAASLDWRSNNHGVWKALVKDMAPDSSVTFSDGLTGTVSGRQVTVESLSMPTGFMIYTTDDNTAVFGGVLYGAGSAHDSLEAIGGEKTVRMGSYTFTGNESFHEYAHADNRYIYSLVIADRAIGQNVIMADYVIHTQGGLSTWNNPYELYVPATIATLYFGSYGNTTLVDFKAWITGKTIYYELAEPTTSTETAQSMSLTQGSDTIGGGSFSATYEGTEYELPLSRSCKYIFRDSTGNDTLLAPTANTTVAVQGGVNKLINLTHWFIQEYEPTTVAEFYKLYPIWKNYNIPYIPGMFLNYKGTGVQTIGFNAYNHATGTAELLGGNKYQICGTYTSVSYVDQWGNTEELELDAQGIFTPTNNGVLTVVGGNATDTCVHLCWSGYKNFGKDEYQWEPFVKNVHNIDIAQCFPEGMNGIAGRYDELYIDHYVQNIKKLTFTGSETFTAGQNVTGVYYYRYEIPGRDRLYQNTTQDLVCNMFASVKANTRYYVGQTGGIWWDNTFLIGIQMPTSWGSFATVSDVAGFKAKLKELYDAGNPLVVYYISKTPVTTQLPSPINLTYPVNDFGTEQSLPVNTTDLVTTDLHADIQYNTDYMRMNTQLSTIFPTVRSLAQQEQDGEIMKTDATAPAATVGNAYNLIDRNAAGTERQFSFDTSGGTQDIADGTAVAKKVMGTTLNLNQLVHDTNENTVESVNGNAKVEDAVEGNVKHLVVSGDTVVVNQLVHEHVEKMESGTGRIWIKDAFEKEAKGLKGTAPRSVVMNQLVQTPYAAPEVYGITRVNNGDGSVTLSGTCALNQSFTVVNSVSVTVGHTYIKYLKGGESYANGFVNGGDGTYYAKFIASTTTHAISIGLLAGDIINLTIFPMCVDLTQYFNGNQTLIDSITTWDDLVAYDSAFASYVSYNTGTVKGVTPALTLNGAAQPFATAPQEMFGVGDIRDEWSVVGGKYTQRIGVVDMGTLTWTYDSERPAFYTNDIASLIARGGTFKDNLVCSLYMSVKGNAANQNKSISQYFGRVDIRDDSYTDAVAFTTAMSGVMLYYELETPVVTDVTPVAFDLVSHDNTIFQTAGDLQASIEATYDGLNQTIALDPAHTYAFNHQYVEDSIITGESSIDCVGTEDNLVDLTQLYAGDATRIAAIHSWASLSSRIHMYRDWLPYNPGEIVNLSATIRVYQHEHAYGVVYDPFQSSPVCQRVELNDGVITEVEEFTSLPAHDFKRCVMDDLATRHVNYYLDPLDSTKKADGTPSVLTGADGDVMVEIPITYWRLDEDYNGTGKILWLVSDTPFTGSEIHDFFYVSPNGDEARTQYVGAYRAVVADAEGNALNTTEGVITQNAGTAATRLLRSVAGALPFNNVSLAAMREAAVRNGGSHVNHLFHEYLLMMMIVEQATLNCQSISMGYSNGKTNALWAWRKSGRTNYGNGTGQTMAVADTNDDDNFYALKVNNVQLYRDADRDADGYFAWSNHAATPTVYWTESNVPGNGAIAYSDSAGTDSGYATTGWSTTADANKVIQFQYRGIENPFGEVWEFDDGMQKYQKAILTVIKVNNILHYVNHLKDGSGTKTAWTSEDGTSTYWTTAVTPANNSAAYSDADCTVDSGYKITQTTFIRVDCELWESVAMADYTSTDQHTTATKVYNKNRHYWPSGSWIKKFEPRSFLPRTLGGGATTYLCDNWYNDNGTGSRVVCVGGAAVGGSGDGLAFRTVNGGLTAANVGISGRLSA